SLVSSVRLFSESVGVPLRRYILWRRLQMACTEIMSGANIGCLPSPRILGYGTVDQNDARHAGHDTRPARRPPSNDARGFRGVGLLSLGPIPTRRDNLHDCRS